MDSAGIQSAMATPGYPIKTVKMKACELPIEPPNVNHRHLEYKIATRDEKFESPGWYRGRMETVKQHKSRVLNDDDIPYWGIVGAYGGKFDGAGYGRKMFFEQPPEKHFGCGHLFVVRIRQ